MWRGAVPAPVGYSAVWVSVAVSNATILSAPVTAAYRVLPSGLSWRSDTWGRPESLLSTLPS